MSTLESIELNNWKAQLSKILDILRSIETTPALTWTALLDKLNVLVMQYNAITTLINRSMNNQLVEPGTTSPLNTSLITTISPKPRPDRHPGSQHARATEYTACVSAHNEICQAILDRLELER